MSTEGSKRSQPPRSVEIASRQSPLLANLLGCCALTFFSRVRNPRRKPRRRLSYSSGSDAVIRLAETAPTRLAAPLREDMLNATSAVTRYRGDDDHSFR